MKGRLDEEMRLQDMSDKTVEQYASFADDPASYVRLLQEMDDCCDDDIIDSACSDTTGRCKCFLCHNNSV